MPVREAHPERDLLPSPEVAATMRDRLVDLWEKGCLQTFTVLDDAILDAVVSETFFYGDSPVAERVLTPQSRPDMFKGAAAGVGGTAPDVALHRRDAAEIARFYFGRLAGLAGLKEAYLFGNMADGPHMCHARTTGITAHTAGGAFVTGNIVCMDAPETEARIQYAVLRVQLVQDAHGPLGWAVQSVQKWFPGKAVSACPQACRQDARIFCLQECFWYAWVDCCRHPEKPLRYNGIRVFHR